MDAGTHLNWAKPVNVFTISPTSFVATLLTLNISLFLMEEAMQALQTFSTLSLSMQPLPRRP